MLIPNYGCHVEICCFSCTIDMECALKFNFVMFQHLHSGVFLFHFEQKSKKNCWSEKFKPVFLVDRLASSVTVLLGLTIKNRLTFELLSLFTVELLICIVVNYSCNLQVGLYKFIDDCITGRWIPGFLPGIWFCG